MNLLKNYKDEQIDNLATIGYLEGFKMFGETIWLTQRLCINTQVKNQKNGGLN